MDLSKDIEELGGPPANAKIKWNKPTDWKRISEALADRYRPGTIHVNPASGDILVKSDHESGLEWVPAESLTHH